MFGNRNLQEYDADLKGNEGYEEGKEEEGFDVDRKLKMKRYYYNRGKGKGKGEEGGSSGMKKSKRGDYYGGSYYYRDHYGAKSKAKVR
jgi:hypothetical protein